MGRRPEEFSALLHWRAGCAALRRDEGRETRRDVEERVPDDPRLVLAGGGENVVGLVEIDLAFCVDREYSFANHPADAGPGNADASRILPRERRGIVGPVSMFRRWVRMTNAVVRDWRLNSAMRALGQQCQRG